MKRWLPHILLGLSVAASAAMGQNVILATLGGIALALACGFIRRRSIARRASQRLRIAPPDSFDIDPRWLPPKVNP